MAEGFITDVDTMMKFFRWCRRYKVDCEKGRVEVLRKMVARKQAKYIAHPEEYLKGKKMWRIK